MSARLQNKQPPGGQSSGCHPSAEQIPVDLRLAHTYIPAIVCFTKASALVLTVANTNAIRHLPTLLLVALPLYLDRVTRSETIFDSNSLLCALFAGYLSDSARAEHHGDLALHMALPSSWALGLSWVVVCMCVLLTSDIQPVTRFKPAAVSHSWVLVLEAVVLALATQGDPLHDRSEHVGVLIRSFAFVCLSIAWTYFIGIRSMIELLNTTTRLPMSCIVSSKGSNRRGTQSIVVQSFTPCMMRFGPVLFLDGWAQVACISGTAAALLLVVSREGVFARSDKSGTGDQSDTHTGSTGMQDLQQHPEYKTHPIADQFHPQWTIAPLFLQQDTAHTGDFRTSIRRAPVGMAEAHEMPPPPLQQLHSDDIEAGIQPQQQRQNTDDTDAEAYEMLMQAKLAMAKASSGKPH